MAPIYNVDDSLRCTFVQCSTHDMVDVENTGKGGGRSKCQSPVALEENLSK